MYTKLAICVKHKKKKCFLSIIHVCKSKFPTRTGIGLRNNFNKTISTIKRLQNRTENILAISNPFKIASGAIKGQSEGNVY